MILRNLIFIIIVAVLSGGCSFAEDDAEENAVYVYNWGDYLDPKTIEMFEEETMRVYSTLQNPNVLGEYLHAFETIEFAVYCSPRDERNFGFFERAMMKAKQ